MPCRTPYLPAIRCRFRDGDGGSARQIGVAVRLDVRSGAAWRGQRQVATTTKCCATIRGEGSSDCPGTRDREITANRNIASRLEIRGQQVAARVNFSSVAVLAFSLRVSGEVFAVAAPTDRVGRLESDTVGRPVMVAWVKSTAPVNVAAPLTLNPAEPRTAPVAVRAPVETLPAVSVPTTPALPESVRPPVVTEAPVMPPVAVGCPR